MKFFKDKVDLNEIEYKEESYLDIRFPMKVNIEVDNDEEFTSKPLWKILEEEQQKV